MSDRFTHVISALDELHRNDPQKTTLAGSTIAAELAYAQRMSAWLATLCATPDETLAIAVRGQHLERWKMPRESYPPGRKGYLSWRREQGIQAGATTAALMRDAGYPAADAERSAALITKQALGRDACAQQLEDCACLVFLERTFSDFARKVEHDHMVRIVQKTWRKMSPLAHEHALTIPMSAASSALIEEALTSHH